MMEIPKDWTFENADVAEAFDKHVREQLPWYDMVTRAVAHIIRNYATRGGVILDIGASTGNIGRSIADLVQERGLSVLPVEPSQEMAEKYYGPGAANICVETAEEFDYKGTDFERSPDVVVFMLTLMFIRPDIRYDVIQNYINLTSPGGAVIIVDRTQSAGGDFGSAMYRLTLAEKIKAGADPAKVMDKELSLMGNQRPLPIGWIESMGGKEFFRFGDFAGWIIENRGLG